MTQTSSMEPVRTECRRFTGGRPRVRVEPMLRIHGYSQPERVRADIRSIAADMAAQAGEICAPVVWYREAPITGCDGNTLVVDRVDLHCSDFHRLAACASVVPFVLTVGTELDEAVAQLGEDGRLLEALFLETAAWLAIEDATKAFAGQLRAEAAQRGLALTRRLAPGYGDWALAEQHAFFSLFEGVRLPVHLLESGLMYPKLSRSGLYGLRPLTPGEDGTDIRTDQGGGDHA